MSNYTTTVRWICENKGRELDPDYPYQSLNDLLVAVYPYIFEDFPIYDEAHREELCVKILRHYYVREIGLETPTLWKLFVNNKMNEIMPYYNKLYKALDIVDNPFDDKNITRTSNRQNDGTSERTQSGVGKTTNKYSDTPSSGLEGVDTDKYLTNARRVDETAETRGSDKIANTENVLENIKGKDGTKSYTELLKEYREGLYNVDRMIIDELSECFMSIY